MRVQMTVQISGTRNGVDWPAPGETVDLPDAEALDLIASKHAEVPSVDAPEPKPAKEQEPKKETAAQKKAREKAEAEAQAAYDALSDEDKAALAALTPDELASLTA